MRYCNAVVHHACATEKELERRARRARQLLVRRHAPGRAGTGRRARPRVARAREDQGDRPHHRAHARLARGATTGYAAARGDDAVAHARLARAEALPAVAAQVQAPVPDSAAHGAPLLGNEHAWRPPACRRHKPQAARADARRRGRRARTPARVGGVLPPGEVRAVIAVLDPSKTKQLFRQPARVRDLRARPLEARAQRRFAAQRAQEAAAAKDREAARLAMAPSKSSRGIREPRPGRGGRAREPRRVAAPGLGGRVGGPARERGGGGGGGTASRRGSGSIAAGGALGEAAPTPYSCART